MTTKQQHNNKQDRSVLWHGLIDSPPDQSENLRRIQEIESLLQISENDEHEARQSVWTPIESTIIDELWDFVLDAVCSPLWLRIRAAASLNVYFTVHYPNETRRSQSLSAHLQHRNDHWLRSITSSTCQVLQDLDATDKEQANNIFTWLQFLEHVLSHTPSAMFGSVTALPMYVGMLSKMLRLLGTCSTQIFAATTICIAALYAHEAAPSVPSPNTSVFLDHVLSDGSRDGMEHFGGALLHVINSCGYPCPAHRQVHLCHALKLLGDIIAHREASRHIIFLNDFKVLVDLILRECTDLPLEDMTRWDYLVVLDHAIASPFYAQAHWYRKHELLNMLESLLEAGAEDDSLLPTEVFEKTKRILLDHIDLLD